MKPAELRSEMNALIQQRTYQATSGAFACLVMALVLVVSGALGGPTPEVTQTLVLAASIGAVFFFARHLDFAGGRAGRLERGFIAEALAGAKLHKIPGAMVYRNVALGPEGPDVDYVVLHEGRLICIEVKARPTRTSFVRQSIKLHRTAQHRAQRLRAALARQASEGKLPEGIPSPHVLVACRSSFPVGALPVGMSWVRHLPKTLADLPRNVPDGFEAPLAAALSDMEEQT